MGNSNWVSHAIDRLAKMRVLFVLVRQSPTDLVSITTTYCAACAMSRRQKWVVLMAFQVQLLHVVNGNHISAARLSQAE